MTIPPRILDWVTLIEQLQEDDRDTLRDHFLSLDQEDRRLRFGLPVNDSHIERYVNEIDFDRSFVYGVRRGSHDWLGIGHLIPGPKDAELGLSVLSDARGHGLGAAIFRYAVGQASRQGTERLYMHFLTTNRAILSIARSAGMQIGSSGGESDAYLVVPTPDELVQLLITERSVS
ncbi:MAG: GNAT family N-acetyltransferase [Burkholderiaceae bacterium]